MHVMMRQIMALFDEYQSKETAKHVLRAMRENARQGFWNGSLPPIGYRVVAAEQRGAKIKKKLELDPLHADTVRLMFRLSLHGNGTSGAMGVKAIATHSNRERIFTRGRALGFGRSPPDTDPLNLYRPSRVQQARQGERDTDRERGGATLKPKRDRGLELG